jgi:hypothetical protein
MTGGYRCCPEKSNSETRNNGTLLWWTTVRAAPRRSLQRVQRVQRVQRALLRGVRGVRADITYDIWRKLREHLGKTWNNLRKLVNLGILKSNAAKTIR